jgi:hypothetical protein
MHRGDAKLSGLETDNVLRPEDQTFAIWDHNLTAEKALRELDRVRRKRLPAFTVDQRSRHKRRRQKTVEIVLRMSSTPWKQSPIYSKAEPGSPNRQV